MPTRLDSQGVLVCEMVVFGIPVITSNIPVKRLLLEGNENVSFIKNDCYQGIDIGQHIKQGSSLQAKKNFSDERTINQELNLFKRMRKSERE